MEDEIKKPRYDKIFAEYAEKFPDKSEDVIEERAQKAYAVAKEEYENHLVKDGKGNHLFNLTSYLNKIGNFNQSGAHVNPIKPKNIQYYMLDPKNNKDNILDMCTQLYSYIQEYKQLIGRYGNLLNYYPVVNPIDNVSQEAFIEALKYFEKGYNYKTRLPEITKKLLKFDVFFGYELSRRGTRKKILKEIPREYCKLLGKDEHGVYLYKFDLRFFDKHQDMISVFPVEFNYAYKQYQNQERGRWFEPDNQKQFAFKFDTTTNYVLPWFSGLFVDLARLQEVKVVQTLNTKFENYKLIHYKIPINEKSGSMDDFLISPDLAIKYHEMADKHLPEGIGLTTNPFELDVANLQSNGQDNNLVDRHYGNLMASSGMSRLLSSNNTTGSTGLNASVEVDESMMFNVLRQYEAFFTRQFSYRNQKTNYEVSFIDSTVHNQDEVHKKYREMANTGFNRFYVSSSAGVSQLEVIYGRQIEKEMELDDLLNPLSTAHTQSSEDGAKKDESKLSDEGAEARDKE